MGISRAELCSWPFSSGLAVAYSIQTSSKSVRQAVSCIREYIFVLSRGKCEFYSLLSISFSIFIASTRALLVFTSGLLSLTSVDRQGSHAIFRVWRRVNMQDLVHLWPTTVRCSTGERRPVAAGAPRHTSRCHSSTWTTAVMSWNSLWPTTAAHQRWVTSHTLLLTNHSFETTPWARAPSVACYRRYLTIQALRESMKNV